MDDVVKRVITLWGAGCGLVIWAGLFYLLYRLLSLPIRRRERALLFIELLNTGMAQGRSAEETIRGVSGAHDPLLGRQVDVLVGYLDSGVRLADAVQSVPRLLPRQVREMLIAGAQLGDYRKVIPACRRLLNDASSRVMSAINFVAIVPLTFAGVGGVLGFLTVFIVPKFGEIFSELFGTAELPAGIVFMMEYRGRLFLMFTALQLMMIFLIVAYAGGEWLASLLWPWLRRLFERVVFLFPWRRRRMQRDFTAILAVLLDAEVTEARAVELAAGCTANMVFMNRAAKVVEKLKSGVKLPEALAMLDDAGEFRWRLTNATAGRGTEASPTRGGFQKALNGWCEALDAKAYQQEQAASQIITTSLVILNGVIVGLIATGLFQALTSIIKQGVMW